MLSDIIFQESHLIIEDIKTTDTLLHSLQSSIQCPKILSRVVHVFATTARVLHVRQSKGTPGPEPWQY